MSIERAYRYVGPAALSSLVSVSAAGQAIGSVADLKAWLDASMEPSTPDGLTPATFVIDRDGSLLLAARGSEHVACAGGRPVLAAGELFIEDTTIVEATNQSTGYCPEPSSWSAVARALDRSGVAHPGAYTSAFVFRRCVQCEQLNVVKDDWFVCDVCMAALPATWNCDPQTESGAE